MDIEKFTSKHFHLKKLDEGIFAAISTQYGGSFSNSGIIDLGDQTIIFDTFNTTQAAMDLKKAANQLTNNPITYVINSHWHGDHIRGNQIFKNYQIVSTNTTKKLMEEIHPERIEQQKQNIEQFATYIHSLETEAKNESDTNKQRDLLNQISGYKEILETLPSLQLTLPTITFDDNFIVKGKNKTVELISYGGAHTKSDVFLFIRESGIVFSGDILVIDNHPYVLDGDVDEWITIIDKILALPFEVVVPGHGKVGAREDFLYLKEYLQLLYFYKDTCGNDIKSKLLEEYKHWSGQDILQMNLKHMCKELK